MSDPVTANAPRPLLAIGVPAAVAVYALIGLGSQPELWPWFLIAAVVAAMLALKSWRPGLIASLPSALTGAWLFRVAAAVYLLLTLMTGLPLAIGWALAFFMLVRGQPSLLDPLQLRRAARGWSLLVLAAVIVAALTFNLPWRTTQETTGTWHPLAGNSCTPGDLAGCYYVSGTTSDSSGLGDAGVVVIPSLVLMAVLVAVVAPRDRTPRWLPFAVVLAPVILSAWAWLTASAAVTYNSSAGAGPLVFAIALIPLAVGLLLMALTGRRAQPPAVAPTVGPQPG